MKKTSQTLNYCIRKTGRDLARIAFEIEIPDRDDSIGSEILLKSSKESDQGFRPKGLLLNQGAQNPLIAIIHAQPGDEIIVRIQKNPGGLTNEFRFKISESFVPTSFYRTNCCQVKPLLHHIQDRQEQEFQMDESFLKRLFKDRHPTWLQTAVNTTLDTWRQEKPTLFLSVAPRSSLVRQQELLVQYLPDRALEEFSDELDGVLLNLCIEQRPESAIRHFFDRIPRADRMGLVRRYSTFVLEHHLDRLSDLELEVASSADARTAFKLRHFLEGHRHALLLARSYPAAFFIDPPIISSELPAEVRQSVLDHPHIWRRSHYRSFSILFRSLQSTLGIQFSGAEFLQLSGSLGEKLRKELQLYLGTHI
jgi:hypothetical protein